MEKFHGNAIMLMSLLACTSVLVAQGLAMRLQEEEEGERPSASMAPQGAEGPLPSSFDDHLEHCLEVLGDSCLVSAFGSLIDKDYMMGNSCCPKLLEMGGHCWVQIIDAIASSFPTKKHVFILRFLGSRTWNRCVLLERQAPVASPSALIDALA
uniref:Prolamin-like domain-containing protein n=1 Tax=Nelumbo nucifera TaxID=4432 RepID=A0A822ZAK8_NELNU|nr:TPA_asm: hypothetical protein HUJ06_014399 [Nelumbo nucifera]